jgi:hypothetical protein
MAPAGSGKAAARKLASSTGQKRRAVLTIVHNAAVFLPIWLSYYSQFFAAEDIYVLDHESTDDSTSGPGFNRIPVVNDAVNHTWMASVLEEQQRKLFERYDVVLTTDIDEIVAPSPDTGTLGEYIDRFDDEFVNCRGRELLHMKDREGPFDPGEPVLAQRRYWFANGGYDKPALAAVPTKWDPGLHRLSDGRFNQDPTLNLVHLHRMDYEICQARHRLRSRLRWSELDIDAGWGAHNLITDDSEFERWFYEDSCFEQLEIRIEIEPVPDIWREQF